MKKFFAFLLLISLCLTAAGQYVPPVEEDVRANIAAWQDLKFGMFIHWGAYSQWGVIESWSLCPEDIDWQYKARGDMDYFEYRNKYED